MPCLCRRVCAVGLVAGETTGGRRDDLVQQPPSAACETTVQPQRRSAPSAGQIVRLPEPFSDESLVPLYVGQPTSIL